MDEFSGETCECCEKKGGVDECFRFDVGVLEIRGQARLGLGEVCVRCTMKSINMLCDAGNKVCHFAEALTKAYHRNSMRKKCASETEIKTETCKG